VIERWLAGNHPIATESIRTIEWVGRFWEAWHGALGRDPILLTRLRVVRHLLGPARRRPKGAPKGPSNDSRIRAKLLDRYGGRKAIGTKKRPGPLHGLRTHEWSALALAVTAAETYALFLKE